MSEHVIKPLTPETWPAFAALADKHNGVWAAAGAPGSTPTSRRARIYYRKEHEEGLVERADYRITCFFTDRDRRRSGLASEALAGALDLIAQAGGGLVESFPQDTGGAKKSASFLFNATRTIFEAAGFEAQRPIGKADHVLMTKRVPPR